MDGFELRADALKVMANERSWRLERISPSTFHQDIVAKLTYLSEEELGMIKSHRESGHLYRARVSNGRWFFSSDPSDAIVQAAQYKASRQLQPEKTVHAVGRSS